MKKKKFNLHQWLDNLNIAPSAKPASVPTLPREIPEESISQEQTSQLSTSPNSYPAKGRWQTQSDGGVNSQLKTVNRKRTTENAVPSNDFSQILSRLEAAQTDITTNYADWRDIGFALADEFGETGRDYYHRISRFYPGYSQHDCDKQYDACLKSTGHGITIKTFFHLAKQAGINLHTTSAQSASPLTPAPNLKSPSGDLGVNSQLPTDNRHLKTENCEPTTVPQLPTFPNSIYRQLPDFLHRVVQIATSNEERDILLLGSLVSISACLPMVHGIYDGRKVYPNLFLFITAQASAGKGRLLHCRQLVNPIHKEMRDQARFLRQQYEIELADYNANKGKDEKLEKPVKPPEKMLFIPANNSSTGAYQLLGDSDGKGLIFETEGDTLALAFKSDYGNYSDGFRKAFHHETISYYRRTDREYVDIENPCLSTVLSGTPKQVAALIPSAENGLFSRFIFYFMNLQPTWKDVFAQTTGNGLDDYFEDMGQEFFELHKALMSNGKMEFTLTPHQQQQFNQFFSQVQEQYMALQGIDYMATIRRMGIIAFRISMVLSVLRISETGAIGAELICEDQDFQTALTMVRVLVKHSGKVFAELPKEDKPNPRINRKQKFLDALPETFNRQKYLQAAKALSIPNKTAEGYITQFLKKGLIQRKAHDHYLNLTVEASPNPDN